MISMHGAVYLAHRTEGEIQQRSIFAATLFGVLLLVLFSLAGLWLRSSIAGYVITSTVDPYMMSNPLGKTVVRQAGAWMSNYSHAPLTILLPVLAYVFGLATITLVRRRRTLLAFVTSALTLAGVIGTVGSAMFPFVMPSSSDPRSSLTVWDCVSSHLTLSIMLCGALIFVPIIIIYTSWAYRVMRGKVTAAYIRENDHSAY